MRVQDGLNGIQIQDDCTMYLKIYNAYLENEKMAAQANGLDIFDPDEMYSIRKRALSYFIKAFAERDIVDEHPRCHATTFHNLLDDRYTKKEAARRDMFVRRSRLSSVEEKEDFSSGDEGSALIEPTVSDIERFSDADTSFNRPAFPPAELGLPAALLQGEDDEAMATVQPREVLAAEVVNNIPPGGEVRAAEVVDNIPPGGEVLLQFSVRKQIFISIWVKNGETP